MQRLAMLHVRRGIRESGSGHDWTSGYCECVPNINAYPVAIIKRRDSHVRETEGYYVIAVSNNSANNINWRFWNGNS